MYRVPRKRGSARTPVGQVEIQASPGQGTKRLDRHHPTGTAHCSPSPVNISSATARRGVPATHRVLAGTRSPISDRHLPCSFLLWSSCPRTPGHPNLRKRGCHQLGIAADNGSLASDVKLDDMTTKPPSLTRRPSARGPWSTRGGPGHPCGANLPLPGLSEQAIADTWAHRRARRVCPGAAPPPQSLWPSGLVRHTSALG